MQFLITKPLLDSNFIVDMKSSEQGWVAVVLSHDLGLIFVQLDAVLMKSN